MKLFLRYTETPVVDLERNASYHVADTKMPGTVWDEYLNSWVEELPGLCAFELEADNLEDAIEEAREFHCTNDYSFKSSISWCILIGHITGNCPEGEVINALEILHVEKKQYFAE